MNNYDEAIELVITNVRARESGSIEKKKIIKALERAKKVEELLGLYQKRFSFYNFDEDKDLREIKLKEKELEEME